MDPIEIEAICRDRLGRWTKGLVEQHATPILLVGIGHDQQEGKIVICTVGEITDNEIILLLQGALRIIGSRKHTIVPEKQGRSREIGG